MMKDLTKCVVALLVASAFLGCDKKETLHLYTWADYINPEYVDSFSKENNCKVVVDTFDSNESAFAKLMAGAGGYDIVFPSSYFIAPFKNAGLIDKIDLSKLPNVVKNFDKRFADTEDALVWYVPYAFSVTGILWRKDKLPDEKFLDWEDMFRRAESRVCIFDDIRELLGVALVMSGKSANCVDTNALDEAVAIARRWKSMSAKMDNESYRTSVSQGETFVSMGYSADAIQLMVESPDAIGFSVPTNGTTCSMDVFTVMKSSEHKDLAYKFIDGLYDPEVAGQNAEYICAPCTVIGAEEFISEDYRAIDFTTMNDDVLKLCEPIKDIGEFIHLFNEAWDQVKRK